MPGRSRDPFLLFLLASLVVSTLVIVLTHRHSYPPPFPAQQQIEPPDPVRDSAVPAAQPPPPDFTFRLIRDSARYPGGEWADSVRLIEVYSLAGKKLQTLPAGANLLMTALEQEITPRFIVEDMNFDGEYDFRLLNWLGTRHQMMYNFWLFNPKTQRFEADTNLAYTHDVDFDHEKKTVFSHLRIGCCYEHESKMMTWENGVLVSQREEDVSMDYSDTANNTVLVTLRRRVNGKMEERTFRLKSVTEEYMGYTRNGWCFQ